MRLNENYIKVIKKSFSKFLNKGEIYLFGSHVDDNKKRWRYELIFNC